MEKEKRVNEEVLDGVVETALGDVVENDTVLVLKKPISFEGKEYKKIDLSKLEDLTARDMIEASKVLEKNGSSSFVPEVTLQYACVISARATKTPVELFNSLKACDAMRLKNKVTSFLFSQD